MTSYALAKAAGLAPSQVKVIEDGGNLDPRGSTMGKLAGALEVTVDELLGAVSPIPAGIDHDVGRPEHVVPVKVVGVASGGTPIESEDLREEYPLLHHLYRSGRYAIRLFGDSMWPTLWDRDLLLVEPAASARSSRTGRIRPRLQPGGTHARRYGPSHSRSGISRSTTS